MAFLFAGEDVCQQVHPSPISDPYWVGFSRSAADLIGAQQNTEWLKLLAGNALSAAPHAFSNPLASVYSGHQFGVWAGQLGDGRAILLGDRNGYEIQLKGAGKTRYSRMGDGRAVLRSSIREFLCSEAMHALGIPTTRAVAVVGSKQPVMRETLETAAVCTRIAPSFLRVGHFEHFAALRNPERLNEFSDYLLQQHFPECLNDANPKLALFRAISERTARLVALWQAVGFCHGVLNSDNTSLLGLTMDYGPFGFLDGFQVDHICNHTDSGGRYAYGRQPQVMHWNMSCLAGGMLPLLEQIMGADEAQYQLQQALEEFPLAYARSWQSLFRSKLGLSQDHEGDIDLIEELIKLMHENQVDFTNCFRALSHFDTNQAQILLRDDFLDRAQFDRWLDTYRDRLIFEKSDNAQRQVLMQRVNPKFILRNHLAQVAIEKAQVDDFSEVERLLHILQRPFDEQDEFRSYAAPPPSDLQHIEVSCSS